MHSTQLAECSPGCEARGKHGDTVVVAVVTPCSLEVSAAVVTSKRDEQSCRIVPCPSLRIYRQLQGSLRALSLSGPRIYRYLTVAEGTDPSQQLAVARRECFSLLGRFLCCCEDPYLNSYLNSGHQASAGWDPFWFLPWAVE